MAAHARIVMARYFPYDCTRTEEARTEVRHS
jgi:hypothetical protein